MVNSRVQQCLRVAVVPTRKYGLRTKTGDQTSWISRCGVFRFQADYAYSARLLRLHRDADLENLVHGQRASAQAVGESFTFKKLGAGLILVRIRSSPGSAAVMV
jgi:hypothetical protein